MPKRSVPATTRRPEAKAAADEYYKRHVVGFYEKDYPQFVTDSFAGVGECYMVMQGASEFVVTGKMKDWDIREGVKNIKVPCMCALPEPTTKERPTPSKKASTLSPAANGRLSKAPRISPTRRIPTNASPLSKGSSASSIRPQTKALQTIRMVSTFVAQNRKGGSRLPFDSFK